jgi:hypothetical protein
LGLQFRHGAAFNVKDPDQDGNRIVEQGFERNGAQATLTEFGQCALLIQVGAKLRMKREQVLFGCLALSDIAC